MRVVNTILFLLLTLISVKGVSQVFPVQATTQLRPPYSLFLSDYAAPGSERLALNVFLVDAGRPELNVRFRLRIEGQGIRIETKPEFLPPPTSLTGGVPLQLISADLAPYFESRNLNFTGISQREYEQRGALPEGLYQFCFEVLEYNRGVKISNTSCAAAWLILNDPPIVNLPRDGEKVRIQEPQQVIFQWTPRHTGSPNSAFSTEYDFKMVEIWPPTRNPNDAILTSPSVFETTTNATTLIYGPAETPLEPGRRYAIQLKARSVTGVEELNLFKNNGLSQVYTFQYGDACNAPTNIVGEAPGPSRIALSWNGGLNETAYKVRYRPASSDNSVWYTDNIFLTDHEIKSLQPNTRYEYQIAATCGTFESTWSTVASITTPDVEGIAYSCGLPMAPFNLDPSQLIDVIKVGDVIRAGDFDVKISKVTGSAGTFSGEGVIEVSYFNKAKVKAEFTNIVVNKELRMVNGFMNVTGAGVEIIPAGVMDFMDKLDETLAQVDSLLNEYEANLPQQFDPGSFVADTAIRVNGTIASVTKDESGNVVIVDASGTRTTVPAGTSAAITDSAGNGYLVDKKGNIHKTSADVAAKAGNREYNLALKFDASPNQAFGFDVKHDPLAAKYERLEGDKYASWKSVATGRTDAVLAILEGTGFDKSKIRFEQAGVGIPNASMPNATTTPMPNAFDLTVRGTADGIEEGLLALYTPPDTTKKEQVLGKLNVATYDEIQKTVVIVPVNGNKYPYSEANLRTQLNKIYGQAVVKWNVQMANDNLLVPDIDPFNDSPSGPESSYGPHMLKVIEAFGVKPSPDTYYLFLVKKPISSSLVGYLPRNRQFGFLFIDLLETEQSALKVIAHELGHGAFNLRHTFSDEKYTIQPKGSTNNLMDYGQAFGTSLFKHQWDQMRYKEILFELFGAESDEMGKYTDNTYTQKVFQQIRCAYINGKEQFYDDFLKKGTFISESNEYGRIILKIGDEPMNLVATSPTSRQVTQTADYRSFKITQYDLNYGGITISAPSSSERLLKLQDFLFPKDKDERRKDFVQVYNNLVGKSSLSSEDIESIRGIANCGSEFFSAKEKCNIVQALVEYGFAIAEDREDLILDLISNYSGASKELYANELLTCLASKSGLLSTLFRQVDNATLWKREDNFQRFLSEITSLWSSSKSLTSIANYQYIEYSFSGNTAPYTIAIDGSFFFPKVTYKPVVTNDRVKFLTNAGTKQGSQEYHYFQPIYVLKENSKNEIMSLPTDLPAIVVAGLIESENIEKTMTKIGLTVDVVLTFTAIGNLTKLRHLTKLQKAGKIVLASIEIGSSSLDILLRYTNFCKDPDYCKALQEYNMYLQLGLMGGELLSAVYKAQLRTAFDNAKNIHVEKRHLIDDPKARSDLDEHFGLVKAGEKSDDLEKFALKLTGSLRKAYDELISSGLKPVSRSGDMVAFLSKNGDEIATMSNSKLTPSRWSFYKTPYTKIETSEGYWVVKDGDDVIGIDLGFKDKRILDGSEVNAYWKLGRKGYEPYLSNSKVVDRVLKPGERFFIVEYAGQLQPGAFASKDRISTISELRQKLAVIKPWKDEDAGFLVVREYEVTNPLRVRDGLIGPQIEEIGLYKGKTFEGGGHQFEFLEGKWDQFNSFEDFMIYKDTYQLK